MHGGNVTINISKFTFINTLGYYSKELIYSNSLSLVLELLAEEATDYFSKDTIINLLFIFIGNWSKIEIYCFSKLTII